MIRHVIRRGLRFAPKPPIPLRVYRLGRPMPSTLAPMNIGDEAKAHILS